MDRLLNREEIERNGKIYLYSDAERLLKLQDAKTAKYYEEAIIPQRIEASLADWNKFVVPGQIREAEKKLIEEIERDGKCGNGDIDYPLVEWNKLKKSREIE